MTKGKKSGKQSGSVGAGTAALGNEEREPVKKPYHD
jgi:hypothetical protein